MAARMVLLLYLWTARCIFWLLEQPSGSLFERHPRMQIFLKSHKVYKVRVDLGDFGAATQKPVWLYSFYSFIAKLPDYAKMKGQWRNLQDTRFAKWTLIHEATAVYQASLMS